MTGEVASDTVTESGSEEAPTGIKVVCGFLAFTALGSLITISTLSSTVGSGRLPGVIVFSYYMSIAAVPVSILMIYGLWTLQSWGWTLSVGWLLFSAVVSVAQIIVLTNSSQMVSYPVGPQLIGVVIGLAVLWYIYTCRHHYGH